MTQQQVDPKIEEKLKQVSKLYKAGQSKAKGGIFSSKDAPEAEKLFNQALNTIRSIRPPTEKSIEWQLKLLESLSLVRFEMAFFLDAAKALQQAYRIATESSRKFHKEYPSIPQYCIEASQYYRFNKNYEKAADILLQCGKYIFEKDPNEAIELFSKACNLEEENERQETCGKYFDVAVEYTLKGKKYTKAMELLEREIKLREKVLDKYIVRVWCNVTGIVLINYELKQQDVSVIRYEQAFEKYKKLSNNVKQAILCKQFIDVFSKKDQNGLDKIIKSGDLGKLLPGHLVTFARNITLH